VWNSYVRGWSISRPSRICLVKVTGSGWDLSEGGRSGFGSKVAVSEEDGLPSGFSAGAVVKFEMGGLEGKVCRSDSRESSLSNSPTCFQMSSSEGCIKGFVSESIFKVKKPGRRPSGGSGKRLTGRWKKKQKRRK
jgi:hypothetical protein